MTTYHSPEDGQQHQVLVQDDPSLNQIKDDARHHERMAMVQVLFIDEFPHQSWEELELEYDHELLEAIRAHKAEYDEQIQKVATERPVNELAKIDLAILRLILHEAATKKTPAKVLIDEGVELAKDFGGENSYAFVNAVLEKLLLPDAGKKKAEKTEG
ncbi:transcription antitermination protein NusB [bacterium]|nr:transcription antitermination protein NusB [bacterium]